MKKYIFTLLGLPVLFGMTNAQSFNISCEGGQCNPEEIEITIDENTCTNGHFNGNISNFQTSEPLGQIMIHCTNANFTFSNSEGTIESECEVYEQGTDYCNIQGDPMSTSSATINFTNNGGGNTNPEPDPEPEPDPGTGGGTTGGGTEGGIVSGGINAFNGIIERLGNIFGEFGPYILYIAIACLGISLLFKALKSLLGFTDNKAKNSIGGRKHYTLKQRYHYRQIKRRNRLYRKGGKYNPQVYYNRKQHNYDQEHGQLKPERYYYDKKNFKS